MANERRAPWLKFYTADWRADPGLRMCGYAARGLWLDLLSLMHEATPYGHLVIGGISPSAKDISALLGGTEKEVAGLLAELEGRRVFSRQDDGTIFSRRMVRDEEQAQRDKANGKSGGNPRLKGNGKPPDNPDPTGGLTPPPDNRPLAPGDKASCAPVQSHSQSPEKERAAATAVRPEIVRDVSTRTVRHINPAVGDPPSAWLQLADRLPDGSPKVQLDPGNPRFPINPADIGRPIVCGAYLDIAAEEVCNAARIHTANWRGDWRPLIAWLRDGIEVQDIVAAVSKVADRPKYEPPASLAYFDGAVRGHGQRERA